MPRRLDIPDEHALTAAFLSGDHEAFEHIFFHYRARLIEYAISIASPIEPAQEMAEEAVHDVFMGLWRRQDDSWLRGTMTQYLFGAVRKRMLTHMAREQRHSLPRDDDALEAVTVTPDFTERLVGMELKHALLTMLTTVTAREQAVFLLRTFARLSYREIAGQLHISPSTARVHFSHARKTIEPLLRAWLADR